MTRLITIVLGFVIMVLAIWGGPYFAIEVWPRPAWQNMSIVFTSIILLVVGIGVISYALFEMESE